MNKSISIKELLRLNNINIIDIRSVEKYNDNHIDGAKNIPMMLLLKEPNKYLDKNQVYYIYCKMGMNSYKTCNVLSKLGYNVVNILGGYESWLLNK